MTQDTATTGGPRGPAETRGGCACGRVRYSAEGRAIWQAYCHCSDCRRTTGAPVSVFVGWPAEAVRFAGAPAERRGGGRAVRGFCADCGTPLSYRDEGLPGEMYLLAGTLDDPTWVRPSCHAFAGEALDWVALADDLPRYPRFSRPRES